MKNNLIIIAIAILLSILTSCETKTIIKKEKTIVLPKHLINSIDVNELEIIEIENCEYLFYKKSPASNMGFGFMAHKGNCKNPIHYYNRNQPKNVKN